MNVNIWDVNDRKLGCGSHCVGFHNFFESLENSNKNNVKYWNFKLFVHSYLILFYDLDFIQINYINFNKILFDFRKKGEKNSKFWYSG